MNEKEPLFCALILDTGKTQKAGAQKEGPTYKAIQHLLRQEKKGEVGPLTNGCNIFSSERNILILGEGVHKRICLNFHGKCKVRVGKKPLLREISIQGEKGRDTTRTTTTRRAWTPPPRLEC